MTFTNISLTDGDTFCRKKADRSKQLVLVGETNEEICAICSDCPKTDLILCSSCPRSYCEPCLMRVLGPTEMEEMRTHDDWNCMQCYCVTKKEGQTARRKRNGTSDAHDDLPLVSRRRASKVGDFSSNVSSVDIAVKPKKSKRKKSELPPIDHQLDEVYYFSQYAKFYSGVCQEILEGKLPEVTEDYCFLCKDGGSLVECDKHANKGDARRCKKVYHTYCLGYDLELMSSSKAWMCPRHYCDICGQLKIYYCCKFCPIAICKKCPSLLVEKYGYSRHIKLPFISEFELGSSNIQPIICQNCLIMVERCVDRGELTRDTVIPDGTPEVYFLAIMSFNDS